MNRTLKGFFKKEFVQALRDPRMRIVLFGVPIIQMTIFGLALSNEVKNIRLAFLFPPHDLMARQVQERCFASTWFVPVHGEEMDPYQLVKSGRADAVLVAPPGGLTKAYQRGEGELQLVVDASNAIRARGVENYVKFILSEVTADKSSNTSPPLKLKMDVRMLFNPQMDTAAYLIPGVMCMVLCLLTIILTSMSMAREKEMGTFETLISAPIKTSEILLGKTLPFVVLGLADVPLILSVGIFAFHVPMRGQMWELIFASFIFVCTTVSVGTLISSFAKNQQQAMMGGFLFLFPAIQLSGVMAPLENIPFIFKIIANLNPLKFFVALLRNIMLKGGSPFVVWTNVSAMAALGALCIWIAYRRFHQTLN